MRREIHIDEALKIAAQCIFTVDPDTMYKEIEQKHGRGSMILALRALAGAYSRSRDVCKRLKGYRVKTFDFGNNNGPVPAHKHPNGGGWVANTAYVADSAYVGPDAKVSDNAQVFDRARLEDFAWVYGNAHVFGDARLSGTVMVSGNAKVSGHAKVFGHAKVLGKACI